MKASLFHFYARLVSRWQKLSARVQFRQCSLGPSVRATGRVLVEGGRNIDIGGYSTFVGGLVPTRLIARPGATMRIARGCIFNYGSRVEAAERIDIGIGCLFGMGVVIADEHEGRVAPVVIENNVWLAHCVQVRPGVRIGEGSVVSAGTIVVADVPRNMLATGNPARLLPLELANAKSA